MIKTTEEMLHNMSDDTLRKYLNLVQDELKLRHNTKAREIARNLANTIQKAIDSGLILQEILEPEDHYTPNFRISNNDGCKLYLIRPDYAEHENDEDYGYALYEWNDEKNKWEKVD